MRNSLIIGAMVVLVLFFSGAGSAGQIPDLNNHTESRWNGTWVSEYYTLVILQNGSVISGAYEPKEIGFYDPGILQGILSGDKKIFSGIWTESGPLELILSDDEMSYTGTGGVRPDAKMGESGTYQVNGTRVETSPDPVHIWTGTWKGTRTLHTWVQNGTTITGSYHPLPGVEDEPGLFEGTVSTDGKNVSGKWVETGDFSFTLSDDGSFWNGTYDVALNASAGSDSWNGTKLR